MAEMKTKLGKVQVTLVQWCNDWFTVDVSKDLRGVVCGVMKLTLNESERDMVRESIANGEAGHMGNWFELQDDGTFKRKPRSLE